MSCSNKKSLCVISGLIILNENYFVYYGKLYIIYIFTYQIKYWYDVYQQFHLNHHV